LLLGLAISTACGDDEASTPELCVRACEAWDACEGQDDYYPYDDCMADCEADGDWDDGYVSCVEMHSTCAEMESECG
jgi:hypothetical protein